MESIIIAYPIYLINKDRKSYPKFIINNLEKFLMEKGFKKNDNTFKKELESYQLSKKKDIIIFNPNDINYDPKESEILREVIKITNPEKIMDFFTKDLIKILKP